MAPFQPQHPGAWHDVWRVIEPRTEEIAAEAVGMLGDPRWVRDVTVETRRAVAALEHATSGGFEEYEQILRARARRYAAIGWTPDTWRAPLRRAWDRVAAALVAEYGSEPDRLVAALGALSDFLAYVTLTIADEAARTTETALRALATTAQQAREDERRHIAREIHDQLGQQLTAINLDIAWAIQAYPHAAVLERLRAASTLVAETISSVRAISTQLRPRLLDDLGLLDAIGWQARQFASHSGLAIDVRGPEEPLAVNDEVATCVFRCLQELLTNVARHAEAKWVQVTLETSPSEVSLTVADNGRGIADEQARSLSSIGLLGIRERVARHEGTFTIEGKPGHGTIAVVRVPR